MAETHNIHGFTNGEIVHRKRMDEIEACVERQLTFDFASYFTIREVRMGGTVLTFLIQLIVMAETHNIRA